MCDHTRVVVHEEVKGAGVTYFINDGNLEGQLTNDQLDPTGMVDVACTDCGIYVRMNRFCSRAGYNNAPDWVKAALERTLIPLTIIKW